MASANQIGYNFDGVYVPMDSNIENYTIGYAAFVVPIVKAIQELNSRTDSIKSHQIIS